MFLAHLVLASFRNYRHLDLQLGPGVSVFAGKNAQGKTNLLEACYYLSTLTSLRAEKESDLATWGSSTFSIGALVGDQRTGKSVEVRIDTVTQPVVRRRVTVNGAPVTRQELSRLMPCCYFCPDDLYMVKGSSSLRRRFLDSLLTRIDPAYASDLSQYQKAVTRRNSAIKQNSGKYSWNQTLDSYDQLVASYGTSVLGKRLALFRALLRHTSEAYEFLAGEACRLRYVSSLGDLPGDEDSIKTLFLEKLAQTRRVDLARGITSVGPHRDDIAFEIGNRTFRYFGSQGEQRSVVLASKMAEMAILEERCGTKPVLLLDDVLSELDATRRSKVLSFCEFGYQVLITTTDTLHPREMPRGKLFCVADNSVREMCLPS